jgi:hypothetical protein
MENQSQSWTLSRPSSIQTIRSAISPSRASWLAITTAFPRCPAARDRSPPATSFLGTPASCRGNSTFSRVVSAPRRLKDWKMKPTCRRRTAGRAPCPRAVTSSPAMATFPLSGFSRQPAMASRVVSAARRSHHQQNFPLCYLEGDLVHRADGRLTMAECLTHVRKQQGCHRPSPSGTEDFHGIEPLDPPEGCQGRSQTHQ